MKSVKLNLIPISEKLSQLVNVLLISDKNKLEEHERTDRDRIKHDGKTFHCNYCLHGYITKELLDNQIAECKPHGAQKVKSSKKEEQQWINFTSINKQHKVPFVIYAGLDCFPRHIYADEAKTRNQKHDPSGF